MFFARCFQQFERYIQRYAAKLVPSDLDNDNLSWHPFFSHCLLGTRGGIDETPKSQTGLELARKRGCEAVCICYVGHVM